MKKTIAVYINRYNSERPHAYLNNTSPEKFEKKHFEKMRQPGMEMNAENLFWSIFGTFRIGCLTTVLVKTYIYYSQSPENETLWFIFGARPV